MVRSVLIADDKVFVRQRLCKVFSREADFEVCGEAENGREAIEEAQESFAEERSPFRRRIGTSLKV
jgi:YesN/AraC family two-component response regulator